jgi:hypothetical protein
VTITSGEPETLDEKDLAQKKLREIADSFLLGRYQHYKGPYYRVFAITLDEETLAPLVHYESLLHHTFWTRTLKNFTEEVTLEGGETRPRFKFVGWAAGNDVIYDSSTRAEEKR